MGRRAYRHDDFSRTIPDRAVNCHYNHIVQFGPIPDFSSAGFSIKWYENLFSNVSWTNAFLTSLWVLFPSTIIATALGTSAAYAIWRKDGNVGTFVNALVMTPVVVPAIITGAAFYAYFLALGLIGTLSSLIIAHSILTTPYVFISVATALRSVDPRLLLAAATLGAHPIATFRQIVLPLIVSSVLSGALFAGVMSFDELVVSLFLSTPRLRTITVQMWSNVTGEVDPTLAAVATVLFAFSLAALVINYLLSNLRVVNRDARSKEHT